MLDDIPSLVLMKIFDVLSTPTPRCERGLHWASYREVTLGTYGTTDEADALCDAYALVRTTRTTRSVLYNAWKMRTGSPCGGGDAGYATEMAFDFWGKLLGDGGTTRMLEGVRIGVVGLRWLTRRIVAVHGLPALEAAYRAHVASATRVCANRDALSEELGSWVEAARDSLFDGEITEISVGTIRDKVIAANVSAMRGGVISKVKTTRCPLRDGFLKARTCVVCGAEGAATLVACHRDLLRSCSNNRWSMRHPWRDEEARVAVGWDFEHSLRVCDACQIRHDVYDWSDHPVWMQCGCVVVMSCVCDEDK